MKKLFLIFVSSFLFAQINIKDLVDRIDLDGTSRKYLLKDESPYSGIVFYNYTNGKKEFEGLLTEGIQDGRWMWFYENGTKKQEGFFYMNQQTGLWTEWFSNGNYKSEGEYVNGMKQGTWSFWHESGGIASAEPYREDKVHGKLVLWHDDGQRKVRLFLFMAVKMAMTVVGIKTAPNNGNFIGVVIVKIACIQDGIRMDNYYTFIIILKAFLMVNK